MPATTLLSPVEAVPNLWTPESVHSQERVSSHDLALAFDMRNQELGVPLETRQRTAEMLWVLGERDARTSDHGRRAADLAESGLWALGDPRFSDEFHAGVLRTGVALHDIWKQFVPEDTMHRSWGDPGYGPFTKSDFEILMPHATGAFVMLSGEPYIPPEGKWLGGCHHQHPDPTRDTPAYGVPLSAIDEAYAHDPQMREWMHIAVELGTQADVTDASTSRSNSYFSKDTDLYKYLVMRAQHLPHIAHKAEPIVEAMLEYRQVHHLRSQSSAHKLGMVGVGAL